jgi:LmbE family N-acetylglucosaminyl deacetylase
MKWSKIVGLILAAGAFFGCKKNITIEDLRKFAATESYPTDNYLDTIKSKRALIIVAHDDDDCAMAGTLVKLKSQGWTIKQLSLQKHKGRDTLKHPSEIISNGNELILEDGLYRLGMDTAAHNAYPLPYSEIDLQFFTDKVADKLIEKISLYKPSVIFTLDDIKGAYGHPDHVFISKLVLSLATKKLIPCHRIYQAVYTPHMESEIVYNWLDKQLKDWNYPNLSPLANQIYGVKGMPEPSTQINISKYAQTKMKYLLAYDDDVRKNIRKFIPYYEEFEAKTYFEIFDREFFRVISF